MRCHYKQGLTSRVQFSIFNGVAGFHHVLSTRSGGVSSGAFDSLNLGFHVGDDAEAVRENRRRFAEQNNFKLENLVAAQQTHGTNARLVSQTEVGRGAACWEDALPDCDALITNEIRVPLLILVADCAPLLLVDTKERVCAVVHAGWRGALASIAGKTLETMKREFGTRAEDVLAAIGPCLQVENLEVGQEVAAQVEAVEPNAVVCSHWPKPHLDLRALIAEDLKRSGVLNSQLEISPLCPKERGDLFFSHRGQNGRAGRFGLVAWWE